MSRYHVPDLVVEPDQYFCPPITLQNIREYTSSQLHVFMTLCGYADTDGNVSLSVSEIAQHSGLHIETVSSALSDLIESGRITLLEKTWYPRKRLSSSNRWQIFKRDGYRCAYCGTADGPFEVDHIIPVSKGGDNSPDNLITCCTACNRKKSALRPDASRA